MSTIAIIQARTGSVRLPGKVLLKLEDKTILEHVIDRVSKSKLVNVVVVATTTSPADNEIAGLCEYMNVPVYRGAIDDVLDRYYQTARLFKAEQVVRITADCPMIDFEIIDSVVSTHMKKNVDYTSNSLKETFPNGVDVEVFTMKALEMAWMSAKLKSEREHVTPYIKKNDKIFKLFTCLSPIDLSKKRWTVDNIEDYEFAKHVFANVYKKNHSFVMKDVLNYVSDNPAVEKINSHIARNEGYMKSLKEDGLFIKDAWRIR